MVYAQAHFYVIFTYEVVHRRKSGENAEICGLTGYCVDWPFCGGAGGKVVIFTALSFGCGFVYLLCKICCVEKVVK